MSRFYILFKGYRLVGDVNFQEASKVAGYITPVPGIQISKKFRCPPKKSREIIKSIYFTKLVLLLFSQ